MHLFYTPDLNDTIYTLSEQESKHCIKVLRLSTSGQVHLIDGKGGFYTAKIMEPNPKKCTVEIVETKKEYQKRNHHLHIAIAPTKNNDRLEWFLEKATEIGIDEITPIVCTQSERRVIKPERLEKILVSAMKQSIKAYKPKLNNLISYTDFINKPFAGDKFIAHCKDANKSLLKNRYTVSRDVLILIGPEGDFSREEIAQARQNNFTEISLGYSRLRTETAGVVACHTINLLNEKEVH
ncbi:MAG TPA: 16S rRNA (uracil(1498)-N(3))-methyltransferase [Bacteroidales bacterium]|nr:16S rRNA (uracil(1498)-N(3))-methyltransferase [Bacteroidales bacterium]